MLFMGHNDLAEIKCGAPVWKLKLWIWRMAFSLLGDYPHMHKNREFYDLK